MKVVLTRKHIAWAIIIGTALGLVFALLVPLKHFGI
jgi:hypothetical protein